MEKKSQQMLYYEAQRDKLEFELRKLVSRYKNDRSRVDIKEIKKLQTRLEELNIKIDGKTEDTVQTIEKDLQRKEEEGNKQKIEKAANQKPVINIKARFNRQDLTSTDKIARWGARLSPFAPVPNGLLWKKDNNDRPKTTLYRSVEAFYQINQGGFTNTEWIAQGKAQNDSNFGDNKIHLPDYKTMVKGLFERFLQNPQLLRDLQADNYLRDYELTHITGTQEDAIWSYWQSGRFVDAMLDAIDAVEKLMGEWKKYDKNINTLDMGFLENLNQNHRAALIDNFNEEAKKIENLITYDRRFESEWDEPKIKKEKVTAVTIQQKSTEDDIVRVTAKLLQYAMKANGNFAALGHRSIIARNANSPVEDQDLIAKANKLLSNVRKHADGFITNKDLNYGISIAQHDQPALLAYKGDINLLTNPELTRVAVIGTLNPNDKITTDETNVVSDLLKEGVVIVSGLAKGCDKLAHELAVKNGGKTIAILPSTLEKVLPSEHQELANQIVQSGGLLITEYLTEPTENKQITKRLIDRDRLQALFSDAVFLIASANEKTNNNDVGSKHALGKAAEWGISRWTVTPRQHETLYGMNSVEIARGATEIKDKESLLKALNALKGEVEPAVEEPASAPKAEPTPAPAPKVEPAPAPAPKAEPASAPAPKAEPASTVDRSEFDKYRKAFEDAINANIAEAKKEHEEAGYTFNESSMEFDRIDSSAPVFMLSFKMDKPFKEDPDYSGELTKEEIKKLMEGTNVDPNNPEWDQKVRALLSPLYQKDELEKLVTENKKDWLKPSNGGRLGSEDSGVFPLSVNQFKDLLNRLDKNYVENIGRAAIESISNDFNRSFTDYITQLFIKEIHDQARKNEDKKKGPEQLSLFSKLNMDVFDSVEEQKRKALDYIQGVLGDQVGVVFKESAWGDKKDVVGEFTEKDGKRLITLAMSGYILSTAQHEAFHAFLGTLRNRAPKHYYQLLSLSRKHKEDVLSLLDKMSPEAAKSARKNEEELAAYTYQLYMSSLLPANALTRKVCGKIQQMLYRIGGLFNQAWREKANANADALEAETSLLAVYRKFNEGGMRTKFSQEAFLKQLDNDLAQKEHNKTIEKAMAFFGKWGDKIFNSADAVLRRPNIPELNEIADLFYNDVVDRDLEFTLNDTGAPQGDFTLRIFSMRNRWVSMYSKIIADLTTEEKGKIRRALLSHNMDEAEKKLASNERLLKGFKDIRNFMDQVYDDLVEKNISSRVITEWKDKEGHTHQKVEYVKWTKNDENGKGNKYRRNYFPFVWSKSTIETNREEFVSLLTDEIQDAVDKKLIKLKDQETPRSHAEYITQGLLGLHTPPEAEKLAESAMGEQDMSEFIHGTPYGSATEKRYLGFILNRDKFDKFFEQDMDNVITDYVIRMSKRAIYQNIFGEDGKRLWHLLNEAEDRLAAQNGLLSRSDYMIWDKEKGKLVLRDNFTPEFAEKNNAELDKLMRPYHQAVSAMCGMLGQDLAVDSPLRKINAYGVTYQNIRLLTFSLFTSFQDVAGLFIHGGTIEDAWDGFCRGLKEIKNSWLKNVSKDELSQMAADFGVVDPLSYIGSIGELNGTQYMTGKMRGWSNKFFRMIGLEGWNRGLKIQAMVIAERRIREWKANGVTGNKADKLLYKRCYGSIDPKTIEFDGEHVKMNDANMYAINRMVADMVMTPTAANRPAWASNPRFLLFAQLKTFTYTMHRVMLRGLLEQARLGNVKPAAFAFASLFPMAAAGYIIKEFLLGLIDDDDDDWKWEARNMVPYIFQRAGALGVPQMYLEDFLSGDWARMFGPTTDQIQNALSIPFAGMWNISQNHTPYKEMISATPMASLIKRLPYVYSS